MMDASTSNQANVAIVEDDSEVRKLFCMALRSLSAVLHEFDGQRSFIASLNDVVPDCAVIDLCLPDGDGLAIAHEMRERMLPTSVLLVSGHANVRIAVDAVQGGVIDVLEKPVSPRILCEAVQRGIELTGQRRDHLRSMQQVQEQLAQLSPAERQVLDLVIQGEPNKRIAKQLQVSQRTVESRRSEIYRKLGVDSVSELVAKVVTARRPTNSG